MIATLKAVSAAFEHPYTDAQAAGLADVLVPDLADVQDGRQERIPQRAASHRRRHRHAARRRREHAGRQRLHRERLDVPQRLPLRGRSRTRGPSPRPEGRLSRRPSGPIHRLGDRTTNVAKALLASRNRYLLIPLAALVVVAASYAALAISGANASPPRVASAAVQNAVTQPSRRPSGPASARPTRPTPTTGSPSGRRGSAPTRSSDQQYVYLGDLYAQKGRETGDVADYALAADAYRKALALFPARSRRARPAWRGTS